MARSLALFDSPAGELEALGSDRHRDRERDRRTMIVTGTRSRDGKDADLWRLLRAIATGDRAKASRLLAASPRLALDASPIGATRESSMPYYFKEIEHYVYAGDTALHVAAAAYRADIAKGVRCVIAVARIQGVI